MMMKKSKKEKESDGCIINYTIGTFQHHKMEYIIFSTFSLLGILICSVVFYRKGVSDGEYKQIYYREYNYDVSIKSDLYTIDKKYQFYQWNMNVEQAIGVGDYISYNKAGLASTLKRDYGTQYFKVIARHIIEGDKSSKAILIVIPAPKAEVNILK
jgi:hypothetical protein